LLNIYLKINEPFKNLYNIDLAEALAKVPEIGLTKSKTKVQKQKETRETVRRMKNKTEEQWSKVDCDTMLGTRQSFRQRDLQGKSLYFESAEEARIRSTKMKALEEAGLRKKKRHSPDPASVTFDKEGLQMRNRVPLTQMLLIIQLIMTATFSCTQSILALFCVRCLHTALSLMLQS